MTWYFFNYDILDKLVSLAQILLRYQEKLSNPNSERAGIKAAPGNWAVGRAQLPLEISDISETISFLGSICS